MERLEIVNVAHPTEIREFSHGRLEVFEIGGQVIGRASYDPGWRWSEHVGLRFTSLQRSRDLRCAVT
jgi:hypothetical protein